MSRNFVQGVALGLLSFWSFALSAAESFPGLQLTDGFKASVWAGDAHTKNPVAISLDAQGRLYTVEAHRRLTGAWGVTMSRWWSMEDYAGKTLADREAMYARWAHIVPPAKLTRAADISRRIVDSDGDGKADEAAVLSEFNGPLEGNAAGVLVTGDSLFIANAPSLWRLELDPVSGRVKSREALLTGFGVRVGVYGHDLHGLTMGPDGRLYFSIGDRGFDVVSKEGRRFFTATRGAVFRCFPDGTGFEVFHIGLRNPQGLAFNQFGDLFTVDNDMGGVDKSRVVHVIEGGDSGWDATYQLTRNFREETQRHDHTEPPWFTENLWKTRHAGQPSWLHPPIAHLTAGPSGLEFYPGTGFPSALDNAFLICDFKGTSSRSGIYSFKVAQDGAGYRMAETNVFAWGILPADIKFGYDGRLYVADWIGGWGGEGGKRRIVRLEHPASGSTDAREVATMFKSGFRDVSTKKLLALLSHPDQRIRFAAQFELARRRVTDALIANANNAKSQLARLHSIWGLWQLGLGKRLPPSKITQVRQLIHHDDSETRAQAAKVLGEIGGSESADDVIKLLQDDSPRVRYFAAVAIARIRGDAAVPAVVEMLRSNADKDVSLRNAGVLALSNSASASQLGKLKESPSDAVRRAAVLALRRKRDPGIEVFLADPNPGIVWETIRAIHDLPIIGAWSALESLTESDLFTNPMTPFPIVHRVLNANFRSGKKVNASRLAMIAANRDSATPIRLEALRCLERWNSPSPFDRVTWHHRPITNHRETNIAPFIQKEVLQIFNTENRADGDKSLLQTATGLIVQFDLADGNLMRRLMLDTKLDEAARRAFFEKLKLQANDDFAAACLKLLAQGQSPIQIEAAFYLLNKGHGVARNAIELALKHGTTNEKSRAIKLLGESTNSIATALLGDGIRVQSKSKSIEPQALDWWRAGKQTGDASVRAMIDGWDELLTENRATLKQFALASNGGDANNGKRLFNTHAVQCVRCHVIKGFGGDAGPELTHIGRTLKRDEIVVSLIEPSARIAEGFGTFEFELKGGEPVAGFLKSENGDSVNLQTMDGRLVSLDKKQIIRRSNPTSAMPTMRDVLNLAEIRDLAAYLSGLK